MDEATLDETPYGQNPADEGWFVLNLGDALAVRNEEKGGAVYPLEPEGQPFTGFGANVHVVWPGEPSAMYHSEGVREAFLVLSGECTLIVEEQERVMPDLPPLSGAKPGTRVLHPTKLEKVF